MTPSSINNLFSPALLSTPSGSGWHISSLEPQTGAKDEPNLLTHLSLFPCLHLFNSPGLSLDSLQPHSSLHLHLQRGETIRGWIFTEAGEQARQAERRSPICFICNLLLCDGHCWFLAVFCLDTYTPCVCVLTSCGFLCDDYIMGVISGKQRLHSG